MHDASFPASFLHENGEKKLLQTCKLLSSDNNSFYVVRVEYSYHGSIVLLFSNIHDCGNEYAVQSFR